MDASALNLVTLRTKQDGRVLTAWFENPPLNFFTAAATRDLLTLVKTVQRDATVGAVVLTGGPPDRFITHFDINEMTGAAQTPAQPPAPRHHGRDPPVRRGLPGGHQRAVPGCWPRRSTCGSQLTTRRYAWASRKYSAGSSRARVAPSCCRA